MRDDEAPKAIAAVPAIEPKSYSKPGTRGESGQLFVGHFGFLRDGDPPYAFGDDWDETLLAKKEAWELLVRTVNPDDSGMAMKPDESNGMPWLEGIDAKIERDGTVLLHFYVTKDGGNEDKIGIFDCSPACPASVGVRASFGTKKKAR